MHEYHLGRLKQIMWPHMLTPGANGEWQQSIHTDCFNKKFGVGRSFVKRYINSLKGRLGAQQRSKLNILTERAFDMERLLLPFGSFTRSKARYFKEMSDGDLIYVLPPDSFKSNAGTAVGMAKIFSNQQNLYIQWIKAIRTRNGRIKSGHGAIYFLPPTLRCLAPTARHKREEAAAAAAAAAAMEISDDEEGEANGTASGSNGGGNEEETETVMTRVPCNIEEEPCRVRRW